MVLIVAAVLAAVLAPFGWWLALIGVGVAVVGGIVAMVIAWGEVRDTRVELMAEQREAARVSSDMLSTERQQHVHTVEMLLNRNGDLRSKLTMTRAQAALLSQETASLRGDKAALELQLREQQQRLEAEVLRLPARATGAGDHTDLWDAGGLPTIVLLQALANPPAVDADAQRRQA